MTRAIVTASEAVELGLVNFLVEGDALDSALALAHRLGRGPQHAIRASKVAVNSHLRALAATIMPLGLAAERFTSTTQDRLEAERAKNEMREPNFTGE